MKTIRILLLALLASAAFVCPRAQAQIGQITNPVSAPLYAQDAGTCSATANSNLIQQLPPNASTTTVNLSGTFSATVTVRASNNGGATWVTLGTASAAGTTTYGTNSYTHLCADVTTYTSGTVNVTISTGVVGGGNGNSGSVSLPTTQVSAAGYAGADWCAKVQAADAAIGANPGIIVVPSTIAGTCAGTLTFAYNGLTASRVIIFDLGTFTGAIATLPNDGTSKQASFRFEGQVTSGSVTGQIQGSVLNLTNNATAGKFDSRAFGLLEIDHLDIEDASTDCSPFVFDTGTVLKFHDNHVTGTASGTSACNNGLVLGGPSSSSDNTNDLTVNSFFGGYGTVITSNQFDKISHPFLLQKAANNIVISNNEIESDCGDATGAPIEFNPASTGGTTRGNLFSGNTLEITNYEYAALYIGTGTESGNNFIGNGLWDISATTKQYFRLQNAAALDVLENGEVDGSSTIPLGNIQTVASAVCTMSATTTCTATLQFLVSTSLIECVAAMRGTATPIAGSCHNGSSTVGPDGQNYTNQMIVNAASSNSNSWSVVVY